MSAKSSARKKLNIRRPPTGLREAERRRRDPRDDKLDATEIDIDGHIAVFKGGSLEAAIRACAAQKKAALEPWGAHVEGLVMGRRGEVVPIRSKR
jgi:hypothetical protein